MKKCALMFNSLPTVENLDFSESEAFVTTYYTCTIRVLLPCNSYLFGIIIFFVWGFKPYQEYMYFSYLSVIVHQSVFPGLFLTIFNQCLKSPLSGLKRA